MNETVPMWQTVVAILVVVAVLGGIIGLQLWSRARRRRGDEGTTSDASGAEVAGRANFPTGT